MPMRLLFLIVMSLLISGCVQTRYAWNGYDDKLYSYYKTPAESDRFMEGLNEIIQAAEPERNVPPGIYAEYGFQLYERGRYPEAVIWYRKERDAWPESRILMDKMIALANSKASKADSQKQQQPPPPTSDPAKEKQQ